MHQYNNTTVQQYISATLQQYISTSVQQYISRPLQDSCHADDGDFLTLTGHRPSLACSTGGRGEANPITSIINFTSSEVRKRGKIGLNQPLILKHALPRPSNQYIFYLAPFNSVAKKILRSKLYGGRRTFSPLNPP